MVVAVSGGLGLDVFENGVSVSLCIASRGLLWGVGVVHHRRSSAEGGSLGDGHGLR